VIVMAVTSQIVRPAGVPGEVLINDWQSAALPKASQIKRPRHDRAAADPAEGSERFRATMFRRLRSALQILG
jgi:hypothetical protein